MLPKRLKSLITLVLLPRYDLLICTDLHPNRVQLMHRLLDKMPYLNTLFTVLPCDSFLRLFVR